MTSHADDNTANPEPLSRYQWLALVAILLTAAVLRFSYPAWDGLENAHPDERYILWVATSIGPPPGWSVDDGLATLLDPSNGGFNPFYWPREARTEGIFSYTDADRSFAYGHLPLYLIAGFADLSAWLGQQFPALGKLPFLENLFNITGRVEYLHLSYAGRAFSAFASTITVLLTFLLGRRLFSVATGLFAASLLAFAVQSIQLAHFATFDVVLTTFATAMVLFSVRYCQTNSARDLLLAAVFAGLAVGSKFSAVLLGLAGITALFWPHGTALLPQVWAARGRRLRMISDYLPRTQRTWVLALAALVVGGATFAMTNPFALLEWQTFFDNVSRQGRMVRGALDWTFVLQYRGTWPYLYHIGQQGQWLWGWPLTILAYAGSVCATVQVWRSRGAALATALAWLLPYWLVTGAFVVKFPRYMLPVAPVMFVLGAGLLTTLVKRWRWPTIAAGGAVLVLTAAWGLAFFGMYRQPHPWIAASDWMYANVPHDSVLLLEDWDDPLPLDITGRPERREALYSVMTVDSFATPDDAESLANLAAALAEADIVVLASNRVHAVVPRFPRRYPNNSTYFAALMDGRLGYTLTTTFGRSPQLGPLVFNANPFAATVSSPDGYDVPGLDWGFADESFTVYDHPRVLVFANRERLDAETLRDIISR